MLALFVAQGYAQQTLTSYVRSGQKVTLRLSWTPDNSGNIQWQQSSDQGATWQNISGANQTTYEKTAVDNDYMRVVVSRNDGCDPFVETHILKTVSFAVDLIETKTNEATFKISDLTLPLSEVAAYGFCYNLSGLSRNYASMQRTEIGTSLDNATFEAVCPNLLPGKQYSVRFYLQTRGGETIYGPGKIVSTPEGLEWSSEDWTITKNSIQGTYKVGDDIFQTEMLTNLEPATTYTLTAEANIGGQLQRIERQVRTMTDYSTYTVDATVTPPQHRIRWQPLTTAIQLNPDNIQAEYPRVLRVSADTLLLTYHGGDGTATNTDHWQNIYLQRSTDNGRTWSQPEKLVDHTKTWLSHGWHRHTNADMVRLQNGWVLLTWSANANPETNHNCQVFVMISRDGGQTWGDPITVLRGRCWEPQIVQLPGGELELLVSSEARWWGQGELYQEIVCARSTDNGLSWTRQQRASYNPRKRDGMPVQVVLQGNKGILFSYESINSDKNPSISWRPLDGEWDSADWDEVSDDRRWVCENIRGGCAPYALQLQTGEVVVCGHLAQNGSVWQTNRTQVCIGDNTGHNFALRTIPFSALPYGEGAYYSSLFQKDESTIWLLYSHSRYNGSDCLKNTVELLEGTIEER